MLGISWSEALACQEETLRTALYGSVKFRNNRVGRGPLARSLAGWLCLSVCRRLIAAAAPSTTIGHALLVYG